MFQAALRDRFNLALEAHYPCRVLAFAVQRMAADFEVSEELLVETTDPEAPPGLPPAWPPRREARPARCGFALQAWCGQAKERTLRRSGDAHTTPGRGAASRIPGRL